MGGLSGKNAIFPDGTRKLAAITGQNGQDAVCGAGPLGDDGAKGYAAEAKAGHKGQKQRCGYVHAVHNKIRRHGPHGILHAYEPSLEGKKRKRGRSGPDADVKVLGGQLLHLRSAVNHLEGKPYHNPLQRQERYAR